MSRDEIIKMAREAGVFTPDGHCATVTIDVAERFAALVAAAEREACAKVCEAIAADNQRTHAEFEWPVTIPKGCGAAIRSRGAA